MSFAFVASQMIVLSLAMAIGFVARKLDLMSDGFDGTLSQLVINITLPCMVISSVFTEEPLPSPESILNILLFSFAVYAFVLIVAFIAPLVLGLPRAKRGVYSFITAFGNVGFIGFPVVCAIFGPQALLYAAIANIPFNLAAFTIGAMFIASSSPSGKKVRLDWKTFVSPVQVACLVAIGFALLQIHDGGVFASAVDTIGSMTTPATLLIVGSSLTKYSPKAMLDNWRAYVAVSFRLVLVPVAVFFVFRNFITDPMLLGVLVVTLGMPVATNGTMLSLKYDGDLKTITQGTFLSTVASILTIPCISMLVI